MKYSLKIKKKKNHMTTPTQKDLNSFVFTEEHLKSHDSRAFLKYPSK